MSVLGVGGGNAAIAFGDVPWYKGVLDSVFHVYKDWGIGGEI